MKEKKQNREMIDAELAGRRIKARGGLNTPETKHAIQVFRKSARLSAGHEAQLARLVDTIQKEAMQLAKRLVDAELAAYIERSAPTHAEKGHWLQLHGQWLIAAEWGIRIEHEQVARRIGRRRGAEAADRYREEVGRFMSSIAPK